MNGLLFFLLVILPCVSFGAVITLWFGGRAVQRQNAKFFTKNMPGNIPESMSPREASIFKVGVWCGRCGQEAGLSVDDMENWLDLHAPVQDEKYQRMRLALKYPNRLSGKGGEA